MEKEEEKRNFERGVGWGFLLGLGLEMGLGLVMV